jgi:protein-tyrosine phosphatase
MDEFSRKRVLKTIPTDELLNVANENDNPDQALAREILTERHSKPKPKMPEWGQRTLEFDRTVSEINGSAKASGAGQELYGSSPYCGHTMTPVVGVDGLYGSSYKGRISANHEGITVILAPEALDRVKDRFFGAKPPWVLIHHEPNESYLAYLAYGVFADMSRPKADIVYWPWPDMSVPTDKAYTGTREEIVKRILWLHHTHMTGHAIEVACFGGHGRTGMLLAILAALKMGWDSKDAVTLLRKAYCTKAVETKRQAEWVRRAIDAAHYYAAHYGMAYENSPHDSVSPEDSTVMHELTMRGGEKESVAWTEAGHDVPANVVEADEQSLNDALFEESIKTEVDKWNAAHSNPSKKDRDTFIVELHKMGCSSPMISEYLGLSDRRVREIVQAHREAH